MAYGVRVTKVEGGDNLSKKSARFLWRESTLLDEIIKQFAARNVLEDQVPAAEWIDVERKFLN